MKNKRIDVKTMALTGLMTALVFVGSRIGFHTPSITGGGYVHLGTAFMFLTAFLFGKKSAAFAGGVGMGLFDLFSEYFAWAPFTFVISLLMGYTAGKIAFAENGSLKISKCIAAAAACTIIKVIGYYITEFIFTFNLVTPLTSIPGNITQMVVGAAVGIAAATVILNQKIVSV
ncbi:MAG: ECF transporter S component [Eubacterium sp.]|nr:ECF transporter S component [Eubacterium sp.]